MVVAARARARRAKLVDLLIPLEGRKAAREAEDSELLQTLISQIAANITEIGKEAEHSSTDLPAEDSDSDPCKGSAAWMQRYLNRKP